VDIVVFLSTNHELRNYLKIKDHNRIY